MRGPFYTSVKETPISQIARTGLHPDPRCKTVRPINIWHPPVCPPCDCNFDPQRHRTAKITFAPFVVPVLAFCDSFYKPNKWFARPHKTLLCSPAVI